jgi:hypothetical protein
VPVDFEHLGSQLIYHDYQDQEVWDENICSGT